MKQFIYNYRYLSILLLVLLFETSCNKLDVQPSSFVTKDNFFKTQADAIASVNAVYASLNIDPTDQSLFGRNLYFLTDMGSDYAVAGASAINPNVRAISGLTHDANTDRIQIAWRQIYNGINRANIAIENIPAVNAPDEIKTRLINEAKFIRALLYFHAVRLWGAVPLVLKEPASLEINQLKTPRTPVNQVYDQIIKDLTDAEKLPDGYGGTNVGRATGGAAKSLLVKVYLTQKQWAKASAKAREVTTGNYGYTLVQNFADLFNPKKKNGPEHIFSAQFEPNQSGNGSSGSTFMGAAFLGFRATEPADIVSDVALFYDIFQPGDTRRDVSFAKKLFNPATGKDYEFPKPIFRKYVDTTILATGGNVAINFPLIRHADILLSLAESINEESGPTDEAYEAINKVRRRAFGKPINTPDPTVDLAGLSANDFREAVYEERKKEFIQEGQRWFDLVRWGRLVSEVKKVPAKAAVSERNNLYPIPQSEVNISGLTQNPGY
ncbi:MAG: RagB/SusD family nutrient uptake outer membrane protein [Ferruginibacter sp.]|nr:RagB/SusD family nutrient uptake outer membrane protein [Ferruginibacter sp.]